MVSSTPNWGMQIGPGDNPTQVAVTERSPLSTEEGRRLVHAFLAIKEAEVRSSIIRLVEAMSQAYSPPLSNS